VTDICDATIGIERDLVRKLRQVDLVDQPAMREFIERQPMRALLDNCENLGHHTAARAFR
jgi:hypothetical protein